MAGLLFAFSSFIMTALGRLPQGQGPAAMNAINVAILNPSFAAVFFGTALLALGLAVVAVSQWGEAGAGAMLTGGLLYLVTVIGVTMVCNVPLNDALAAAPVASEAGQRLWQHYLTVWTGWNHLRTLGAAAATVAFILALR